MLNFDIVFNPINSRYNVEERLEEIINEKINATLVHNNEIRNIVKSLDILPSDAESFAFGIVIGRLYNSFNYQCRRILKRSPTDQEFSEFLKILKQRQSEFLEKLQFND